MNFRAMVIALLPFMYPTTFSLNGTCNLPPQLAAGEGAARHYDTTFLTQQWSPQ